MIIKIIKECPLCKETYELITDKKKEAKKMMDYKHYCFDCDRDLK